MLIGLVGKPSAGKSTFFKAATLAEVDIANYPFTTIEANEAAAYVKIDCIEKFFKVKCNPQRGFCIDGNRFVAIKVMDVAGLVPGAHEGKGLGLSFLNDLSTADVLIHIVDVSGSLNEKGEPVEMGSYDPCNDIRFLEKEIDFWILGLLKKNWGKFSKKAQLEGKDASKALAEYFTGLKISLGMVKQALQETVLKGKSLDAWTDEDLQKFASTLRRISKPIIIAANKMDLPTAKKNLEKLKKEFSDHLIVPCSAETELALREAAKKDLIKYVPGESDFEILKPDKIGEKQKKALEYIQGLLKKWKSTGVQDCLNAAVFDFLKYIVVFPGGVNKLADKHGNVLPDAFLLPPGSTALDFAARIHRDLADGFIRAIDVKTKKTIGKDHKLKHCDVIEIISSK